MRLLKEAGCELDQADNDGVTPAYAAAYSGHESCLRVLQEAGCDLGQADIGGRTPAHEAVAGKHEGCIRLLAQFYQESMTDVEMLRRLVGP